MNFSRIGNSDGGISTMDPISFQGTLTLPKGGISERIKKETG